MSFLSDLCLTVYLPVPSLAFQEGGADLWGPITGLMSAGLGLAAVLAIVVGGLMIAGSPANEEARATGTKWVLNGVGGLILALCSGALYLLFVGG